MHARIAPLFKDSNLVRSSLVFSLFLNSAEDNSK